MGTLPCNTRRVDREKHRTSDRVTNEAACITAAFPPAPSYPFPRTIITEASPRLTPGLSASFRNGFVEVNKHPTLPASPGSILDLCLGSHGLQLNSFYSDVQHQRQSWDADDNHDDCANDGLSPEDIVGTRPAMIAVPVHHPGHPMVKAIDLTPKGIPVNILYKALGTIKARLSPRPRFAGRLLSTLPHYLAPRNLAKKGPEPPPGHIICQGHERESLAFLHPANGNNDKPLPMPEKYRPRLRRSNPLSSAVDTRASRSRLAEVNSAWGPILPKPPRQSESAADQIDDESSCMEPGPGQNGHHRPSA